MTPLPSLTSGNRRALLADAAVASAGAVAAVLITGLGAAAPVSWLVVPVAAVARPAAVVLFRLERRVWRYAGVSDIARLWLAILAGSVLVGAAAGALVVGAFLSWEEAAELVAFEYVAAVATMSTLRFVAALHQPLVGIAPAGGGGRRVLLYGAGELGGLVAREMQANQGLGLNPVAFIDDDPVKHGLVIAGVPVVGTSADLARVIGEHPVDEVLVTQARVSAGRFQEVKGRCAELGLPVRALPGLPELLDETVSISRVRPIRVEELLGRPPQALPERPMRQLVEGSTVLVTGGGGSIGSELCRQIGALRARRLIVLDRAETPLFFIAEELQRLYPGLELRAVLMDVADERAVNRLLSAERPQIVFHAAAHKHVPLSESNVAETIHSNVAGTRVVAEAAKRSGVNAFIFISTDKAVDPSSVMGATKRLGEGLVEQIGRESTGRFVTVRFGNVLGSQGSVVQLFREQIARGGPVTVTDPAMTRFFMTIPEAVRLILLAGAVGQSGDVHVLNMGNPIKIEDLAREMIRISDPTGKASIEIAFTGLRPGEKLEEELFAADETPAATEFESLLLARRVRSRNVDSVARARAIEELALNEPEDRLRAALLEPAE